MRVTAATCVGNKGPFLLEWMVYDRFLGVTGVLICSNDCSDRTDVLPDVLAPWGVAQLPNPASGRNDQMER